MDSKGICVCIQCGYTASQNPTFNADGTYSNKHLMKRDITHTDNFGSVQVGKNTVQKSVVKHDTGKPMVSLVEPSFILGIAQVLTYGAEKYAINNWQQATDKDIRRIKDSLLRHTLAYTSGELLDAETGLSHSLHAATNMMFLNYLLEKQNEP